MAGQTATTGTTTGSFDASLKDFYEGMIRRILNRQARLYAYSKKGTKTVSGRQVLFPVNIQGTSAVAFTQGGNNLPAAVAQKTIDAKIPMQEVWGRISVNTDVIEQARDNRGAFERPVALEVSRMAEDLIDHVNIALFGDGTGKLGEVLGVAGGGNTVDLKGLSQAAGTGINANAGSRYLKIGDNIDILTAAFAVRIQGLIVSSVSIGGGASGSDRVTFTAAPTAVAATDGVYWGTQTTGVLAQTSATVSMTPMGVGGIVDDGTFLGTLQAIDRTVAANVRWKANAINVGAAVNTPGALTLDLMQRSVDLANEVALGFPGVALCHHSVRREYIKQVQTDRRYTEPFKYEPGINESHLENWPWTTTLSFDGFPIAFDKHCQWQTMYFLDPRVVRKWVWKDFHWVRNGRNGGDTMYLVPGVAGQLEAQCAMFFNLGTDEVAPSTCTVLRNISSTIDRFQDA